MKILSFLVNGKAHVGLKLPEGILDLTAAGLKLNLQEVIEKGKDALAEIKAISDKGGQALLNEDDIDFLPPASPTSKLLCVGLNYKLHVDEGRRGRDISVPPSYPEDPVLFSKFNNALNAHKKAFTLLPGASNYDYEAELVLVIGKGGLNIAKEDARSHIFGYTCGNDISARDAQRLTSQWLIGKSLPGAGPVGPWIVTADELDPTNLDITCKRGDVIVQSSNTSLMIFDIDTIISFASKYIRLEAGDLIYTGTPNGVISGYDPDKRVWLAPGEVVTVSIEGIGDLVTLFQ